MQEIVNAWWAGHKEAPTPHWRGILRLVGCGCVLVSMASVISVLHGAGWAFSSENIVFSEREGRIPLEVVGSGQQHGLWWGINRPRVLAGEAESCWGWRSETRGTQQCTGWLQEEKMVGLTHCCSFARPVQGLEREDFGKMASQPVGRQCREETHREEQTGSQAAVLGFWAGAGRNGAQKAECLDTAVKADVLGDVLLGLTVKWAWTQWRWGRCRVEELAMSFRVKAGLGVEAAWGQRSQCGVWGLWVEFIDDSEELGRSYVEVGGQWAENSMRDRWVLGGLVEHRRTRGFECETCGEALFSGPLVGAGFLGIFKWWNF